MGSKRRYKIGIHKTYDDCFDRFRLDSQILNSGSAAPGDIFKIIDWSKDSLKSLLLELKGNEEGYFYKPDSQIHQLASIPAIENKLTEIDEEFKRYQQMKVNEGHALPEQMPLELMEQKLKAEAKLDVYSEELEQIQKMLEKCDKKEQEASNKNFLNRKRLGCGKLRCGILISVDGQHVSTLNDVLIIDDDKSPYDGMATSDYFTHICKAHAKAHIQLLKDMRAGKIPYRPNKRPPLPAWPEGCVNHKKVTDNEVNKKRKKQAATSE
jgi:hypothetical protein